jgi:hypothetical protein
LVAAGFRQRISAVSAFPAVSGLRSPGSQPRASARRLMMDGAKLAMNLSYEMASRYGEKIGK